MHGKRESPIERCIRESVLSYLDDLHGVDPSRMYAMVLHAMEKPLLEVVMERTGGNQSRAAEWLGLNRNTLRKKLQEYQLLNK